MSEAPFSNADLHLQLTEEVKALREILSLLSEQEQAILSAKRSHDPSVYRNAKQYLYSLRKKRFNLLGSVIGCTDFGMLDTLFNEWIIASDTDCDIITTWEQVSLLMEKIGDQESKNQALQILEKASPRKPGKNTRKLDIMDA